MQERRLTVYPAVCTIESICKGKDATRRKVKASVFLQSGIAGQAQVAVQTYDDSLQTWSPQPWIAAQDRLTPMELTEGMLLP